MNIRLRSLAKHGTGDRGDAGCRVLTLVAAALAACTPAPQAPPTVVQPPSAVAPAPLPQPPADVPKTVALPSMALPVGPIYACDVGGTRTPIRYDANVEALCRRHPEMGPCKFERDACRRGGGRVYTAKGEEVTAAVEAEYDRHVRRVTFQADGAPKKK